MSAGLEVSELWIYPVKGCRGVSVERAALTARGLADDRRYMLVDLAGRFVSQREEPRLARVAASLVPTGFVLASLGVEELALERSLSAGERVVVTVWESTVEAWVHAAGSRWFSGLLGRELRLVFMPDSSERQIDLEYASPGQLTSFADGFPLLVTGQGSLDELNRRLERPVEMRRFRPSLVVRGAPAHAEDEWRSIRAGEVELALVKPCTRCVVTTLDPETGAGGVEPLATLASYRRQGGGVTFGVNAIPTRLGSVALGDRVEVRGRAGPGTAR